MYKLNYTCNLNIDHTQINNNKGKKIKKKVQQKFSFILFNKNFNSNVVKERTLYTSTGSQNVQNTVCLTLRIR